MPQLSLPTLNIANPSPERAERQLSWLAAYTAALATHTPSQTTVFLGDLNVLEPGHQPRYRFFAPFEYDFYRHLTDDCDLIDAFRALHPEKSSTAGSAALGMATATTTSTAPPTSPPRSCPATTSTRPASTDSVTTPRCRCAWPSNRANR